MIGNMGRYMTKETVVFAPEDLHAAFRKVGPTLCRRHVDEASWDE